MVEKNLTQAGEGKWLIPVEEEVEVKAGATKYVASRGVSFDELIFHLALCGESDIVVREPIERENWNGNGIPDGDKWQEWRNTLK